MADQRESGLEYDAMSPKVGMFEDYMKAAYGGVIVAPKGGFQVDDIKEAFIAGWVAAIDDHVC